jgi:hypothetical protein
VKAKQLAWRAGILSTAIVGFLLAEGVFAQSSRPWVDPPRPGETPGGPPAAPPVSAQPEPPGTRAEPRRIDIPPGPQAPAPAEPPGAQERRPPSDARPFPPPQRESGPRGDEAAPISPTAPPARSAEPPGITFPSKPEPPAITDRRPRESDRVGAAQQLLVEYLSYWSAPNAVTLDATPDFYAPQVLFHGRQMSARALFEQKRHFVRRWPVRDYWPRPETMRTTCDPAPPICTVRTMFEFKASNPQTGRLSQGTAHLQLGVSFADGEPMIVFESSQVVSRGASARSEAFEDVEDDRN